MLVAISVVGFIARAVQRKLEPEDHHIRRADFQRQLGFIVWSRLQNELMIVSSCVLWAWLAHESGLLDAAAWLSVTWQQANPSPPIAERPTSPYWHLEEWIPWMLSCHPRMPRDPTTALHLLQDVTVALLATQVFYFGFLWATLTTQIQWLSTYERLEAGGAPRNAAEAFMLRQLDAMREQLLAVLRSDSALKQQVERSADQRQSVENGVLYVSGFLAETMHAHLELVADFSPQTWMLILAYVGLLETSLLLCVEYNQLSLLLDVVWYLGSLYLC